MSYTIERRGTDYAPWCVVHRGTGLTVPVLRPYPVDQAHLPPIWVANHRSREQAEAAAQEIDWNYVDEMAQKPEVQAGAKRAKEQREHDAAYQRALAEARAGREPWPWEPGGFLHQAEVVELPAVQLTLDEAA